MKSRRLFECISEIDDELIREADEYDTVKKKKNMLPFIASAAVIVLLVLSGFVLRNTGIISPEPPYTNTTTEQSLVFYNQKKASAPSGGGSSEPTGSAILQIIKLCKERGIKLDDLVFYFVMYDIVRNLKPS